MNMQSRDLPSCCVLSPLCVSPSRSQSSHSVCPRHGHRQWQVGNQKVRSCLPALNGKGHDGPYLDDVTTLWTHHCVPGTEDLSFWMTEEGEISIGHWFHDLPQTFQVNIHSLVCEVDTNIPKAVCEQPVSTEWECTRERSGLLITYCLPAVLLLHTMPHLRWAL